MSWYPPPQHGYGAHYPPPQPDYGGAGQPPAPGGGGQYPYGAGGGVAPPAGYGQQAYGGQYQSGGAPGYYQQQHPPPPPLPAGPYGQPAAPPLPPAAGYYHHHHQQQHPYHQQQQQHHMAPHQPRYDYAPPPPQAVVPQPMPPPPPQQTSPPPLKEGELRPPPDVAHDPNSFRRYFKLQLDHLTYNSKPVITSLTLFAHEHAVRMASVVAQCFDEHLRTCPPPYILPAFYLLDSICKNIGAPYVALFSRFIERAFLSAYHSVDPSTRTKLEELLGTWKTGGPDGGELFREPDEPREGARVQRGIEGALFGARGRGDGLLGRAAKDAEMYNAGVQQLPHTATTTERSGVLYDVRRLLTLRQDVLSSNPADQINASQIVALKKLENLILNTQLTTEQVTQIRNQLAALAPPAQARTSASASPAPAPPPPPSAAAAASPAVAQQTPTNVLSPRMPAPQQQQPGPSSYPQQQQFGHHLSPPPPPIAPQAAAGRHFSPGPGAYQQTPTPTMQAAPAPPPQPQAQGAPNGSVVNGIDLGLLSQLSASGALANLFGGGGGGGNSSSPSLGNVKIEAGDVKPKVEEGVVGKGKDRGPIAEIDEMAHVWEEEVIRMGVTLNAGDLATPRPHALALLYLQLLPLQCRQCGLRQPDSRTGKRKMDEHLDWHFVHKRRIREATGRASGRSWFTSEEDWYTSDSTHHPLSAADQPSSSLMSAGAAASAASAAGSGTIDRAALQKQKVAVPAAGTPEAELGLGDKPCPICQDRFKSEWSDEEEEWVWWNAVVVDKTLYHATCHAEAALSRSNAAASVAASRNSVRTSRESTPTSRKRKAGSVDPLGSVPSPLKPQSEQKLEQDATISSAVATSDPIPAGATDDSGEPDAKRVKAEPQEGMPLFRTEAEE